MSCVRRVGGDVADRPRAELAVLVCLAAVHVERIVGEAVEEISHFEWASYTLPSSWIHLHNQVLVAPGGEIGGVDECHVDGAIGSDGGHRPCVLIAGCATLGTNAEGGGARDF